MKGERKEGGGGEGEREKTEKRDIQNLQCVRQYAKHLYIHYFTYLLSLWVEHTTFVFMDMELR